MPQPPSISKKEFMKIFEAVASVYDAAMKDVSVAVDAILKVAYYKIGRIIVECEQKGKNRAGYGDHLLERLADELSASGRKGFSVSNLKNMRQVYRAFSIRQISGELTWSHLVALSSVNDQKLRLEFHKKAIKNDWNVEMLQEAIRHLVDVETQNFASLLKKPTEPKIYRMNPKRGLIYTYRVYEFEGEALQKKEPDPDEFEIDLGFRTYITRKLEPGQKKPAKGELVSMAVSDDGEYILKFWRRPAERSLLFTYRAILNRVTDGDTITVNVDLGFGFWKKQKLRLRKIDAPEIETAAGKKAKAFVLKRLKAAKCIVIKTYSTDVWDRFIVDIFYSLTTENAQETANEGTLLNQELLDAGLADVWMTIDPEEIAFMN